MGMVVVCADCALLFIPSDSLSDITLLAKKPDINDRTTITTAKVHVAFSKKSAVFLTPIIWLEDENSEAKPPPFEFCINTTKPSNMDAIIIIIMTAVYILFSSYSC
jgi:hypothetical protein